MFRGLLNRLDEGYDLVSGWKQERKDSFLKRLQSKIFNSITSAVTGLKLRDFNCGFKAYRREVTHSLNLYGELYRFIPALAHAEGFRVSEISVNHRPRIHGKSKYSYERIIRAPFDLFTYLLPGRVSATADARLPGPNRTYVFGRARHGLQCLSRHSCGSVASGSATRPLLLLGTLLIIVGIQIVFFACCWPR